MSTNDPGPPRLRHACWPTRWRSPRIRDGRWGAHEIRPTGPIEIHPGAHVLHYASECFEGFKAYRWTDGSIHVFRMDKHIERMRQSARLLVAARAGRGAARGDGARRSIDRVRDAGAGAPGRAVPAADAVRHHAEHRRGLGAVERGDADRAREPGVGLLRRRRQAAAHLRRGPEAPHRRAPRHGQDRRQLRRGHGPDARGARQAQGRPGAVLPGRLGAGDRRGQLPADPRGPHPDAQPRLDVPARRDARFAARHGPRPGLQGRGARVRRGGDARVGEDGRSGALGHGGRAGRRRHAGAPRARSTASATARSARSRSGCARRWSPSRTARRRTPTAGRAKCERRGRASLAVVTGAGSPTGIGFAIARSLGHAGLAAARCLDHGSHPRARR